MQDTAHAAGAPTVHQGGLLENPLEQASPHSRMRASVPFEGVRLPRAGSASLEGPFPLEQAPPRPSRTGSASLEDAPHSCARARAQAFNAMTTAGRRHHAPGARAPVPPHQLPRRDPIPATMGGTVRRGRCQSRDAEPPTPVRLMRRALEGGPAAPSICFLVTL
jgi:hypothetical protein